LVRPNGTPANGVEEIECALLFMVQGSLLNGKTADVLNTSLIEF
jgi:hypothetical protein